MQASVRVLTRVYEIAYSKNGVTPGRKFLATPLSSSTTAPRVYMSDQSGAERRGRFSSVAEQTRRRVRQRRFRHGPSRTQVGRSVDMRLEQ